MTLSDKKGFLSALEGLVFTVLNGLPSKIDTFNAANSVEARALLPGPYVLASDSTLKLTLTDNSEVAGTISADTYTAAQLATAVNAIPAIAALFIAYSFYDDTFFGVKEKVYGNIGKIVNGAGTINNILGWSNNQQWTWGPLPDIAEAHIMPAGLDSYEILQFPALRVWGDSDPRNTTGGECVIYSANMRLYGAYDTAGSNITQSQLGYELLALSDLITQVIYESTDFAGHANTGHQIQQISLSEEILDFQRAGLWVGYVDFLIQVSQEEDLRG